MLNPSSATSVVVLRTGIRFPGVCLSPSNKDRGKDLYFLQHNLEPKRRPPLLAQPQALQLLHGVLQPIRGNFLVGFRLLHPAPAGRSRIHTQGAHTNDPVPAIPGHGPAPRRPRAPLGRAGFAGHGSVPETCFPGPGKIFPRKIVSAEN